MSNAGHVEQLLETINTIISLQATVILTLSQATPVRKRRARRFVTIKSRKIKESVNKVLERLICDAREILNKIEDLLLNIRLETLTIGNE